MRLLLRFSPTAVATLCLPTQSTLSVGEQVTESQRAHQVQERCKVPYAGQHEPLREVVDSSAVVCTLSKHREEFLSERIRRLSPIRGQASPSLSAPDYDRPGFGFDTPDPPVHAYVPAFSLPGMPASRAAPPLCYFAGEPVGAGAAGVKPRTQWDLSLTSPCSLMALMRYTYSLSGSTVSSV